MNWWKTSSENIKFQHICVKSFIMERLNTMYVEKRGKRW